jgi:hypothetical protein
MKQMPHGYKQDKHGKIKKRKHSHRSDGSISVDISIDFDMFQQEMVDRGDEHFCHEDNRYQHHQEEHDNPDAENLGDLVFGGEE